MPVEFRNVFSFYVIVLPHAFFLGLDFASFYVFGKPVPGGQVTFIERNKTLTSRRTNNLMYVQYRTCVQ